MKRLVLAFAVLALASPTYAAVYTFPSASSSIVGSVGFIDSDEAGYFWSASRGDSIQETFADPLSSVSSLLLELSVGSNVLSGGQQVDWDVLLNGIVVGSFSVVQGFTGDLDLPFAFAPIASPGNYTVRIEVTNNVPGGGGSHTFVYDGRAQHSVTLSGSDVPEPSTMLLLSSGLVGLVALRRRNVR